MAVLDEILAVNSQVAGRLQAADLDFTASRGLCLVTCIDPRLTRFFPQALGLDRGEATIVRLPGPVVAGGSDLLRAVATAIYANGCDEILVLSHTDCAMVRLDPGAITSAMNRHGVSGALPTDPRSFFGLAASPRQIASDTASALRRSPLIPRKVLVHAAVIDIQTGALEVVSRGENAQAEPPAGAGAAPTAGLPSLSGPSSLPALAGFGGIGSSPSSLPSLSSPGFSFSNSLPEGLGIGEGSTRSAAAAPLASFGPVSATAPSVPIAPVQLTSFEMPAFDQGLKVSSIDLTPSVTFGPPVVLQPVEPMAQPSSLSFAPETSFTPDAPQMQGGSVPKRPSKPTAPPPRPQPARPPPRKAAPPQQPAQRSAKPKLNLSPEMMANLDKVGAFYRAEMRGDVRAQAAADLDGAYQGGSPNTELIRVVFKPILESGPKRYKVIDELLAIKEGAARLERGDCYLALRQLLS